MLKGSLVAIVTPMHADGGLDINSLRKLIDFHVEAGTDGIVIVGTTGESPTVDVEEHCLLIKTTIDQVAGRVPVIAGTGANSTREAIELTQKAKTLGADACLLVAPYYNKPTPEGLYQHYRAIAEAVELPIIVYNVPSRTGCNVDPATLIRLSTIPHIVGVKEASGNVTQMCEICAGVPDDFIVLSGDDALTLPLMAVGGRGIVSVASNEIPAEMSRLVEMAERGDFAGARALHQQLLSLLLVNFIESNPIPVKSAMASMGLLEEVYRLPMVPPGPRSKQRIEGVLQALGVWGGVHA